MFKVLLEFVGLVGAVDEAARHFAELAGIIEHTVIGGEVGEGLLQRVDVVLFHAELLVVHGHHFAHLLLVQVMHLLVVEVEDVLGDVAGYEGVFVHHGDGDSLIRGLANLDLASVLVNHIGTAKLVVFVNLVVGPQVVFLDNRVHDRGRVDDFEHLLGLAFIGVGADVGGIGNGHRLVKGSDEHGA